MNRIIEMDKHGEQEGVGERKGEMFGQNHDCMSLSAGRRKS